MDLLSAESLTSRDKNLRKTDVSLAVFKMLAILSLAI